MSQRNPRLASIEAGSGALYMDDKRVGRAHFSNVVTDRGRKADYLFLSTVSFADGTITMQGLSSPSGPVPSAITGGTGAYAGARGYTIEDVAEGPEDEFRVNITFVFIP